MIKPLVSEVVLRPFRALGKTIIIFWSVNQCKVFKAFFLYVQNINRNIKLEALLILKELELNCRMKFLHQPLLSQFHTPRHKLTSQFPDLFSLPVSFPLFVGKISSWLPTTLCLVRTSNWKPRLGLQRFDLELPVHSRSKFYDVINKTGFRLVSWQIRTNQINQIKSGQIRTPYMCFRIVFS